MMPASLSAGPPGWRASGLWGETAMNEPIDVLAVASELKNNAARTVMSLMPMNGSPYAAALMDRARADYQIAAGDYLAAETLMLALRAVTDDAQDGSR